MPLGGGSLPAAAESFAVSSPPPAHGAPLPPVPLSAVGPADTGLLNTSSADEALGLRRRPAAARRREVLLYSGAGLAAGLLLSLAAIVGSGWLFGRQETASSQPSQGTAVDSPRGVASRDANTHATQAQASSENRAKSGVGKRSDNLPRHPARTQAVDDPSQAEFDEEDRPLRESNASSQKQGDSPEAAGSGPAAGRMRPKGAAGEDGSKLLPRRGRPPRNNGAPHRLAGVSREYDDLQCQQIQARHAVRVPPGAAIVEIDGQRLAVENVAALTESRAPFVFLPRGQHAVRFRANESPIEVNVEGHLGDEYRAMRAWFGFPSNPRSAELVQRSAWAFDVHGAPFLLHLLGVLHVQQNDLPAAERKFRRALRINAAFSPAHLNLAHCLLKRGEKQQAEREVLLAEAFNVGNVFGLARQIVECKGACGLKDDELPPVRIEPRAYLGSEPMDTLDERMVALLEGLAKYAVEDLERAKILNNLAVHFADVGKTELALDHYRNALAVLKFAGPERFEVARQVLANMRDACRAAGFAEAEEYDQMLELVLP